MERAPESNGRGANLTDEQIVQSYRAGDAAAAGLLFDRYFPLLRARVRRRLSTKLRRRVGESDVIQEAYLGALDCLDKFEDRGEGSFGRWLNVILEHKIIDLVRHHVGAKKRSTEREETQAGSLERPQILDRHTPSIAAASAESASRVLAALKSLPTDHRTILDLVHVRGLSLPEAASAMGRTHGAVRMLYGRAVTGLRMELENGEGA
jgi:RNA polymerase sigma-70 factor (subfamily 1)